MGSPDPTGAARPGGPAGSRAALERVLGSDVASLVTVTGELEDLLARESVSIEVITSCSLVLEEIVTNSFRHGRARTTRFAARLTADHVVLQFEDDGCAFDPLAAPPPDLTQSIEDRAIGGLGIHLVRKLADRVEYERAGELNRLIACIPLRPQD